MYTTLGHSRPSFALLSIVYDVSGETIGLSHRDEVLRASVLVNLSALSQTCTKRRPTVPRQSGGGGGRGGQVWPPPTTHYVALTLTSSPLLFTVDTTAASTLRLHTVSGQQVR